MIENGKTWLIKEFGKRYYTSTAYINFEENIYLRTLFVEFKGALTEQYVLQQFIANKDTPYYWSKENSTAEIDFLYQEVNNVLPIEVKAEENLQAKSLRNYVKEYTPGCAYRCSMSDYREEAWMTNWPLYAVNVL